MYAHHLRANRGARRLDQRNPSRYVILPTGKFVRGQGEVARARGSQTQTTWGTDHGCQATEEDLTDQMAKEAYKTMGS